MSAPKDLRGTKGNGEGDPEKAPGDETTPKPDESSNDIPGIAPDSLVPPISDSINLDDLRISQDFADEVPVRELLATLSVRKPQKHEFVRVHPDPAYSLTTMALRMKDERDLVFLVDRPLWEPLREELTALQLVLAVSKQRVPFIWALRQPASDGRFDNWGKSALVGAAQAQTHWVRVSADMARGAYRVQLAEGDLGQPVWPAETFQQLLKIAFADAFIRDLDHPALLRLRGVV